MAYDEGLADRIRMALARHGTVDEIKMFGGLCFMLQGNMCCGIMDRDGLIARVGPDAHDAALARPHVRGMDMHPAGRSMRGMVVIDPPGTAADADLQRWVDESARFVLSLPPKEKKPKKPMAKKAAGARGKVA